jgi:hypothetical protein
MADKLIKINYDDIWASDRHSSNKRKGILYRGNSQKMLERRVIQSMMDKKPTYWGTENEQRKLTFCSPIYRDALFYADYWIKKHMDFEIENKHKFPHAFYPLMMEIKADKYKDRIYRSTGGEGLIIAGPINLDDITVNYSTKMDNFMEKAPEQDKERKYLRLMKEAFERDITSKGIQKDDLLDAYAKSPDQTTGHLLILYHGIDMRNAKPRHLKAIAKSMEALRAKFG